MSQLTPIEFSMLDVICTLVKSQLSLAEDQVWIYNQKRPIPEDSRLYVEVEFQGYKTFGSASHTADDEGGNFCEYQSVNVMETYAVRMFSRSEEALTRAPEILMALSGVAAQQLAEQYCFRLGPLNSSALDASAVEASARLFREDLTFNALRHHSKKRIVHYFDQFNIPPTVISNS